MGLGAFRCSAAAQALRIPAELTRVGGGEDVAKLPQIWKDLAPLFSCPQLVLAVPSG